MFARAGVSQETNDAGSHLYWLLDQDLESYGQLKKSRGVSWGKAPTQPVHRCIDHLCHYLIVTCQGGTKRVSTKAMRLTERECELFLDVKLPLRRSPR